MRTAVSVKSVPLQIQFPTLLPRIYCSKLDFLNATYKHISWMKLLGEIDTNLELITGNIMPVYD